jgi:hypothetical protein
LADYGGEQMASIPNAVCISTALINVELICQKLQGIGTQTFRRFGHNGFAARSRATRLNRYFFF